MNTLTESTKKDSIHTVKRFEYYLFSGKTEQQDSKVKETKGRLRLRRRTNFTIESQGVDNGNSIGHFYQELPYKFVAKDEGNQVRAILVLIPKIGDSLEGHLLLGNDRTPLINSHGQSSIETLKSRNEAARHFQCDGCDRIKFGNMTFFPIGEGPGVASISIYQESRKIQTRADLSDLIVCFLSSVSNHFLSKKPKTSHPCLFVGFVMLLLAVEVFWAGSVIAFCQLTVVVLVCLQVGYSHSPEDRYNTNQGREGFQGLGKKDWAARVAGFVISVLLFWCVGFGPRGVDLHWQGFNGGGRTAWDIVSFVYLCFVQAVCLFCQKGWTNLFDWWFKLQQRFRRTRSQIPGQIRQMVLHFGNRIRQMGRSEDSSGSKSPTNFVHA